MFVVFMWTVADEHVRIKTLCEHIKESNWVQTENLLRENIMHATAQEHCIFSTLRVMENGDIGLHFFLKQFSNPFENQYLYFFYVWIKNNTKQYLGFIQCLKYD